MYSNGTDIVWMSFEINNFFTCIVVEDSDPEIITPNNYPILSCNEFTCSNRSFRNLDGSNFNLCFVIPNLNTTRVQGSQTHGSVGWKSIPLTRSDLLLKVFYHKCTVSNKGNAKSKCIYFKNLPVSN